MTTTAVCGDTSRARRSTSRPSAPGMRRSVTTTSNSCRSSAASASVPSAAVSTLYPSSRRTSARLSRTPGSSSATRMASAIADQRRGARRGRSPGWPGRTGADRADGQDRHGGVADDLLGDAADQQVSEARPPGGRHHDRVGLAGGLHRHLVGIAQDGAHVGLGAPAADDLVDEGDQLLLGAGDQLGRRDDHRRLAGGDGGDGIERGDRVDDDQTPAVRARQSAATRRAAVA